MVTPVDDLAAWLTAVWDEQEKAAREALNPDFTGERPKFYDSTGAHRDDWGLYTFHVDPASVLARIAADRQILALHSFHLVPAFDSRLQPIPDSKRPHCDTCASQDENGEDWPCATVRLMAQPYADRPGYQEARKP